MAVQQNNPRLVIGQADSVAHLQHVAFQGVDRLRQLPGSAALQHPHKAPSCSQAATGAGKLWLGPKALHGQLQQLLPHSAL